MFVCHICVSFRCSSKTDMNRHYKKKIPCKFLYKTNKDRQKLYEMSVSKRYYFKDVDKLSLSNDDFLYIIQNYCNDKNYIDSNYRSIENVIQNLHENTNLQCFFYKNDDSEVIQQKDTTSDHPEAVAESTPLHPNQCEKCMVIFATGSSLLRHLRSKTKCDTNCLKNGNIQTYKLDRLKNIMSKTNIPKSDININGGNVTIGNIENIGNITNNHNTQNNLQSTTKIEVRDFIHDIYDHSHIDYHELSHDFFVLGNFLDLIMENKVNHNIICLESDSSNAIVLSRNDLRKMPIDKAGFMMLEKLYKTMMSMVHTLCNSEEHRTQMKYMHRYYKILMDKYRCDTTYREYDIESRTFYSTQQGNQLRSRDEYLADILRVLNKHHHQIKEDLFQSVDIETMGQNYLPINPNIEDFSSVRARYRDMKS